MQAYRVAVPILALTTFGAWLFFAPFAVAILQRHRHSGGRPGPMMRCLAFWGHCAQSRFATLACRKSIRQAQIGEVRFSSDSDPQCHGTRAVPEFKIVHDQRWL